MDRLIDIKETSGQSGIGRTNIYESVKNGTFPQPVKIGRSLRFFESEVQAWIRAQQKRRDCMLAREQQTEEADEDEEVEA